MKPEDLHYAKTHEWVSVAEVAGQKIATVGISAFAVEALTDLVFIELPKVGGQVEAEQPFCEVESVKAGSTILFPRGAVHMLHNTGTEEMKVVCFFAPPTGLDNYRMHEGVDFPA